MSTKTLAYAVMSLIAGTLLVNFFLTTPPHIQPLPLKASTANPASLFCIDNGGSLTMNSTEAGVSGTCSFPPGDQCEEWALFRGECDIEGVSTLVTYRNGDHVVRAIYRAKLNTVLVHAPSLNIENLMVVPAVSASGARYETPDKRTEFWEHQGELTLSVDGTQIFIGKKTE